MNKTEAQRINHLASVLMSFGFSADEFVRLRRISLTLRRWHERECGIDGGCIERDDKDRPYWVTDRGSRYRIPDRETGARNRLATILKGKPVQAYIQTDPRGAALYILRPGDIPEGYGVESCYTRGICVY